MNAPIASNTAAAAATAAITVEGVTWTASWISSLVKFLLMSTILVIALILMFTLGNLNEIQKNFPRYRCNPLLIPFSSYFGYDTKDNFNFCLSTIFDSKAAEIFAPIYQLLAGFVSLTKLVVDVALGIRKLFSNFLIGVNGFILSVRDRIQQLLFNIRMSFMRMQHLMNRVYGTMYAVVWMGTSAITAGFNISDNSLVQFLFEFCFDPETQIELADGTFIAIKDAKLGMKLASTPHNPNPEITSVFVFDGSRTSMVNIDGIVMSSQHFVAAAVGAPQKIPAHTHPRAVPAPSIPRLYCLNVTGHEFIVRNAESGSKLVVADYDEHSSPEIVLETQMLAERSLNGGMAAGKDAADAATNDYELGIDPDAEVYMKDGTWKQLSSIQIGDIVWNAGRVYGIVSESVHSYVVLDSLTVSASQLTYDHQKQKYVRNLEKNICGFKQLSQLITENGSSFKIRSPINGCELYVRDYREIPDPEMESAYAAAFMSKN